jgi:hypothetical protein
MIHIDRQPEPPEFDSKVRQPGLQFLKTCPEPTAKKWKGHNFWKRANDDLYGAYSGVCAYTGEWFSRTPSVTSVDHFLPKSKAPCLAYEWSNYRLTTQKANNNKDNHIIIDPFDVQLGWFTLEIPSCLIVPGENLAPETKKQVEFTLDILKLNSDDGYVERRHETIRDYINGEISFPFLQRQFPFIASELERKNLTNKSELTKYFKQYSGH